MKIIDKDKTIDKILESDFPMDLLKALVELDMSVMQTEDLSESVKKGEDVEEAKLIPITNVLASSAAVVDAFRACWAEYEEAQQLEFPGLLVKNEEVEEENDVDEKDDAEKEEV